MNTIEEAKKTINEMTQFFIELDDELKKTQEEIKIEELKQEDLLHEIEISKLNAIERMRVYTKLEKVRKNRRKAKDKLKLINTLKGFADEYIKKGICRELGQVMNNLENLEKEIAERKYNPRVLKDLKCGNEVKIEKHE